jgi:small conductance mechanosensitive channel
MGADVYIPNRSIANVINYPAGYVRCLADITLSKDPALAQKMEELIPALIHSVREQFPGIVLTDPTLEEKVKTRAGKEFLRIKFRLWPGRTGLIETSVKQELFQTLKEVDPSYADWMVAVNYEIERKSVAIPFRSRKKFG